MEKIKCDVVIIGAGSGGFGALNSLIKNDKKVVIVDKNGGYGGTSVFAGVNCYEPGVSGCGVHRELAKYIIEHKFGGVGKLYPNTILLKEKKDYVYDWSLDDREKYPWVISVIDKEEPYVNSEKKCYICHNGGKYYRRFQFTSAGMSEAMNYVVSKNRSNVIELFNTEYKGCKTSDGKIESVTVERNGKQIQLFAKYFVDCSGDVVLSRDAGVEAVMGIESHREYNEPSAPKDRINDVNGITTMFTISRTADKNYIERIPEKYLKTDTEDWEKNILKKDLCVAFINENEDETLSVNMLPTMLGREYFTLSEKAHEVCVARVYKFFNYLQTQKGLKGFKIEKIYNFDGIRESYRIKGVYVLDENQARKGYKSQEKANEFIAFSDHLFDCHGDTYDNAAGEVLDIEIDKPYGIPLDCCRVKEFDNLFAACRGISTTHIVNSSIRLSRTIMCVGEGVGYAICQLLDEGKINYAKLQKTLHIEDYKIFMGKYTQCKE